MPVLVDIRRTPARDWIQAAARAMKAGGEISVGTTSRAFAGALAAKMAQAAETDPSIRPVKAGYIRRMLQAWGVWPFSVI